MSHYLNLDALALTAYVLTVVVCLGLIVYVIWGWQKRVRYGTRKLKQ